MAVKFTVPPPDPEPKHDVTDCTDRPDIIAACENPEYNGLRGGWRDGRFYVYTRDLKVMRGETVEFVY